MIYRSIRIDLYQDRKVIKRYMIVQTNSDDPIVFSFTFNTWIHLSHLLSWNVINAYTDFWQYGNKEPYDFFNGYTKKTQKKRLLTPKVHDGAVDIQIRSSYYIDRNNDPKTIYILKKEDYVPHCERKII